MLSPYEMYAHHHQQQFAMFPHQFGFPHPHAPRQLFHGANFHTPCASRTPVARTAINNNYLTPSRTVPQVWGSAAAQHSTSVPDSKKTSHPGSNNVIATTVHVKEKNGKQLERELCHATRDELIQILVDLSTCNPQAAAFIESKAMLINIKSAADNSDVSPPRCDQPAVTSNARAPTNQHDSPSTTLSSLQKQLHDRNTTPQGRGFSSEQHPCLRMFGCCRHSASCIFSRMPQNLCVHWVRGECNAGAECGLVHRLPEDCPEQMRTVFKLNHGGNRRDPAFVASLIKATAAVHPSPMIPCKTTLSSSAVTYSPSMNPSVRSMVVPTPRTPVFQATEEGQTLHLPMLSPDEKHSDPEEDPSKPRKVARLLLSEEEVHEEVVVEGAAVRSLKEELDEAMDNPTIESSFTSLETAGQHVVAVQ